MPELSVGAAEFATMRRACLLYLADHGDVDAIRHNVVSVVATGERQVRLRHLIGAWQWVESREWPRTSDHEDRPRQEGERSGKPGRSPISCRHGRSQASRGLPPTVSVSLHFLLAVFQFRWFHP
ncbi:hypothetical protein VXJ25_07915 [Olsenella sp. YH-ols2223]|uniref:Uncharacterized protein n=1 Tax=Olsenella absiana TaxID=3115222 RepID=A0ABU7RBE7_9ACTN